MFIIRVLLSFIGGLWRRFFGGYDSKYDTLEKRGVQATFCIVSTFLYEFFFKHQTWYISLIIAVLVYIFWCKGHWYYLHCGTESDQYIDEQMAKGRKPAMDWIVKPVNKWLGFPERSRQYCFVGLTIRYVAYSILISYLVGWQFTICAFAIPFIYNACFWINLPNNKFAKSPTNWAEIFSGFFIAWALI